MRIWQVSLLAGAAAAALGFAGAAAQAQQTHLMTVQLPGGGVAQIEYSGTVAPRVRIGDAPALPLLFGPGSPFARLDRISAAMDREAAAMFDEAATMAAAARTGHLSETAMHNLPPGGQSYSFVSTMAGNHVCSHSVEISRPENGGPPQVVRHSSGNCAGMPGFGAAALPNAAPAMPAPGPTWTSAPARAAPAAPRPDAVWTSAEGVRPYAGLVTPIPTAAR